MLIFGSSVLLSYCGYQFKKRHTGEYMKDCWNSGIKVVTQNNFTLKLEIINELPK